MLLYMGWAWGLPAPPRSSHMLLCIWLRRRDGLVAKLFGGKKKKESGNKPWLQW